MAPHQRTLRGRDYLFGESLVVFFWGRLMALSPR